MANFTIELKDILTKPFEEGTVEALLETELAIVPDLIKMDGNTQTFFDTFLRRNWDKEIGNEVIENWCWDVRHCMDDIAATLLPKLKLQLEHFNDVLSRTANIESNTTSTQYYNPANISTADLKIQDRNTVDRNDKRVVGLFKTNPEVMAAMTDIRMVYGEILEFLDRLFMGVI